MAAVNPLHISHTRTVIADGAPIKAGRFVKLTSPGQYAFPGGKAPKGAHATAATDAVYGISLNDADDGKPCTVALPGSEVPMTCAAAVDAGAFVTAGTDGKPVSVSGRATATGIATTTTTAADTELFVANI